MEGGGGISYIFGLENISQILRTSLGFGMNMYVLELYGEVRVASENFLDQYRLNDYLQY